MVLAGGQSIRYASMLTLDLRKKSIQDKDPITKEEGLKIGVHIVKNHCNQTRYPYLRSDYYIKFGEGTQVTAEVIELAEEMGVLTKGGGGWYSETDINTGEPRILPDGTTAKWHGLNKTKDYLLSNPDYFNYLKNVVMGNEITLETMSEDEVNAARQADEISAEEAAKLDALLTEGETDKKKKSSKKK